MANVQIQKRRAIVLAAVALCLAFGRAGAFPPAGRLSEHYYASQRSGASLGMIEFSPHSDRIAYQQCKSRCLIVVFDLKNRSKALIAPPAFPEKPNTYPTALDSYFNPSFHPDGERLVFTKYRSFVNAFGTEKDWAYSFALATASTGIVAETKPDRLFKSNALILADGDSYIFAGADPSTSPTEKIPRDQYLFKGSFSAGSSFRVLPNTRAWQFASMRMFRKDELVFWAFQLTPEVMASKEGLFRANLQDEKIQAIRTSKGRKASLPQIYPNGDVLYILRTDDIDGKRSGAYVYDLFRRTANEEVRLTHGLGFVKSLAASPDGNLIAAIMVAPDQKHEVAVILRGDGRELFRIPPD